MQVKRKCFQSLRYFPVAKILLALSAIAVLKAALGLAITAPAITVLDVGVAYSCKRSGLNVTYCPGPLSWTAGTSAIRSPALLRRILPRRHPGPKHPTRARHTNSDKVCEVSSNI